MIIIMTTTDAEKGLRTDEVRREVGYRDAAHLNKLFMYLNLEHWTRLSGSTNVSLTTLIERKRSDQLMLAHLLSIINYSKEVILPPKNHAEKVPQLWSPCWQASAYVHQLGYLVGLVVYLGVSPSLPCWLSGLLTPIGSVSPNVHIVGLVVYLNIGRCQPICSPTRSHCWPRCLP